MSHTKRHQLCSVAILCAVGLSSGAFAANDSKENQSDAHFNVMDINTDGMLSPDEHAAGAKKMFDTMDANKDGIVTAEEMDAAHERVAGRNAGKADMSSAEKIKVTDTSGDGTLTAEEHAAGSKMMFDKMDTNHDGHLSKGEVITGHAKMMKQGVK